MTFFNGFHIRLSLQRLDGIITTRRSVTHKVLWLVDSLRLYIYIFRSSGTDILHGCHLLRRLYAIRYFLSLYNEFFIILYNILKIVELDCHQIIILSTYVPSTHAYTHVICLSLDLPYETR